MTSALCGDKVTTPLVLGLGTAAWVCRQLLTPLITPQLEADRRTWGDGLAGVVQLCEKSKH